MAKLTVKAGTTSRSEYIYIQNSTSTTGAGLTGLVFNSAGLSAYYVTERGTATAITLATLASATTAYSSGGFIAVDGTNMPGLYRLDIPSAVLAGNKGIVYLKGATNMVPVLLEYDVVAYDRQDTVRLGLTSIPNVASGSAGAIVTSGTGTAQLSTAAGLVTAGTVSDKTGYSLATAPLNAAQTASAVWDALLASYTTANSFGRRLIRGTSTSPSYETFITGSNHIASDVHEFQAGVITSADFATDAITSTALAASAVTEIQTGLATSSAVATVSAVTTKLDTAMQLDGAVYQFTTNALELAPSGGGGGGGSTTTVRMGPYSFSTPDTRSGEAISTMVGSAHDIEFQLKDAAGNEVATSGATVTAKVYSLAGTLVDTYTATSIYASGGRGYFTLDSTVTGTAGTYRVTLTRTTGATDTSVFGPVTLYVREV